MSESAYWILRCENRLLTTAASGNESIFPSGRAADFGNPANVLAIGHWQGRACYAADVAQLPEIPAGQATPLRAIFQLAGSETFALAGRATQLLDWQIHHRFCGQCGTANLIKPGELSVHCPGCGLPADPQDAGPGQ